MNPHLYDCSFKKSKYDRIFQHIENCFWGIGLFALSVYGIVVINGAFHQVYENWILEETLKGELSSPNVFISHLIPFYLPIKPSQTTRPTDKIPARAGKTETASSSDFFLSSNPSLIGRLEIPRLGLKAMIDDGIEAGTLRYAVGHVPGTALPGDEGNTALAGHRDTYFRALRQIRLHDDIVITTAKHTYHYEVQSIQLVSPRDVWVLNNSKEPLLTLVTCFPFDYIGPAPKRFIVRAREVKG